jgi:2-polyprenyl-3-methyl-5-hydroxy-6-metoxy-1,4-benzoquinol methylase
MTLITDKQCPVCGGERLSGLLACEDRLTHRGTFAICVCEACGFRFTNPYPSQEDIHVFYESDDYVPVSNTTKGLINKGYHLARRVMLRAKRRMVSRLTGRTSGRLLDIGCGTGEFAGIMKEAGWQVQGVEPFAAARESAKARFGVPVADVPEQAGLFEKSYDLITLWHVLEHAHDVNRSMREIDRLLAPGGTVLIGVPNHTCYDEGVYREYWAAYDTPRHLFHFAPDTMRRLAAKHGFEVAAIRPLLFDPLYIPLLTEKERKDRSWLRGLRVAAVSFCVSLLRPTRCTAVTYVLRRGDKPGENAQRSTLNA